MNTTRPDGLTYLCYSHISPELARLNFFNRFGADPLETHIEGMFVYVGPCPEETAPVVVTQPAPAQIMESQLSFF